MGGLERRIAIIGAAGMLGHAIRKVFPKALVFDIAYPGMYRLDITKIDDLKEKLRAFREQDLVINTAAFTKVDEAETEVGGNKSYGIDVVGPINLAHLSRTQGLKIVHYSTAFVFDGKKGNYNESDETCPLNNYGAHKLEGEGQILGANGLVLRTDTLYGPNGPDNFVDAIAKKAREQEVIPVVNDQICSPTYTYDLAAITRALVEKGEAANGSKIYHAVNQGAVLKAELAKEVLRILGLSNELQEISTEEYNKRFRVGTATAQRPRDYSLSTGKLIELGITPREWRVALIDYLKWD